MFLKHVQVSSQSWLLRELLAYTKSTYTYCCKLQSKSKLKRKKQGTLGLLRLRTFI